MHLNSKLLFERYAKSIFKSHMRVLEIGPDKHPSTYREMVGDETIIWETLDIFPSDSLTNVAENEYRFPIPDETFDIVLSGQVIEHVKKIWVWIKELTRICKRGGRIITIAPASWPYHARPVDCWRIYPEGMKALYEEAGLSIELCKFETLELPGYKRLIPGETCSSGSLKMLIRRLIGWSITCSFDTIAIGIKE